MGEGAWSGGGGGMGEDGEWGEGKEKGGFLERRWKRDDFDSFDIVISNNAKL